MEKTVRGDLKEREMELLDIYNADRQRTGRMVERGTKAQPGEYHLVVHACVFNSRGEMLIQQRQPFKLGWSNLWDVSMGGHADAGESSREALGRELREELGLHIETDGLRPVVTVNFPTGFDDYYTILRDVSPDELTLQPEEVQRVKWASREEIFAMIDSGEFIPYYKSMIGLLFDCRGKYGCRSRNDVRQPL